jgi:hypothetical protein
MIISISGKMGSGKDTVGTIIQGLNMSLDRDVIHHHATNNIPFDNTSGWEVRKFADKLKDIACMLIGCTREQLEDQEFKKTMLGSEWDQYRGWSVDGIPPLDPSKTYPMTKTAKLYSTKEQAMEVVSMLHKGYDLEQMTVRAFLQKLGTDAMRNNLHENVWVNALMCDYRGIPADRAPNGWDYPNWIITDTRFPNELEAVKKRNGITIRVGRPSSCVCVDDTAIDCLVECDKKRSNHPSETALDNVEFDYEIVNDGSIDDLISKVKVILIKESVL